MNSAKDDILNGVIKFINKINDNDKSLSGMSVIRKYQDAPRPVMSKSASDCKNYAHSTYVEVWIDELNPFSSCNGKEVNQQTGIYEEISVKEYRPVVSIDVIGCEAFDVAITIASAFSSKQLVHVFLPEYLAYFSQTSIVDVTALEETRHVERVTLSVELGYLIQTIVEVPTYTYGPWAQELIDDYLGCPEELNETAQ